MAKRPRGKKWGCEEFTIKLNVDTSNEVFTNDVA